MQKNLHPYLCVAHRMARGTRIYDGLDEIHIATTALRILASYDDTLGFDFTDPRGTVTARA